MISTFFYDYIWVIFTSIFIGVFIDWVFKQLKPSFNDKYYILRTLFCFYLMFSFLRLYFVIYRQLSIYNFYITFVIKVIIFCYKEYKNYQIYKQIIQNGYVISLKEISIQLHDNYMKYMIQQTIKNMEVCVNYCHYIIKKKDRQDCSICLNNIGKCKKIFITSCNHHFHKSCMKQLLKIHIVNEAKIPDCPNCRQSIF